MVHRVWKHQRHGRRTLAFASEILLAALVVAVGVEAAWEGPIQAQEAAPVQAGASQNPPSQPDAQALERARQELERQRREQDELQAELTKRVATLKATESRLSEQQDDVRRLENKVAADRRRLDDERFGEKGPIGENGITIGRAKVFDNRSLTLLLESLSETLRGLQVIEQDPLRKALGQLQGSQITDVARSLSVLGGGSPKVVTTEEASSQADVERKRTTLDSTDDGKDKDSLETLIDRKLSEKLGLKRETTTAERNPALPALPDLIGAPGGTPGFGLNAGDLLTDQVNLTYQILNIRMLLERSLSDRLLEDGSGRLQAVLGFNVSIDPPRDAENSAAVVEVSIQTVAGKPVSLVSLMPQEKTYNAVAMHTRSNAFGGSAVAGMFTVGYSERRRGQTYYLYRDNDTLSFERTITKEDALTFGWQFRPVLGRKSVSPGMRQMFAVVSLPTSDAGDRDEPLMVSVRSYWRKYHADTLTTSEPGKFGPWPYLRRFASLGLSEAVSNGKEAKRSPWGGWERVPVPTTTKYQTALNPVVHGVTWAQIDEKTAVISVTGENFFSGTHVAMGAKPVEVLIKSSGAMDIVTPIENIGAGVAMVIGRYGSSAPLTIPGTCRPTQVGEGSRLSLPFGGQRELVLRVPCTPETLDRNLVLFVNGKRVPGSPEVGRDRAKDHSRVVAQIPAGLFGGSDATIALVSPFRGYFRLQFAWYEHPYELTRTAGGAKTILFVRRTDNVDLLDPDLFGVSPEKRWKAVYGGADVMPVFHSPTLMKFELDGDAQGSIALYEPLLADQPEAGPPAVNPAAPPQPKRFSVAKEDSFNVHVLDLPAARPKPREAIEAVTPAALVMSQNDAPTLAFTGEKIADVASVFIEGRAPFRTDYDSAKKILTVSVPQDVTKAPAKNLMLQFRDSAGKAIAMISLEVTTRPRPTKTTASANQTLGRSRSDGQTTTKR